MVSAYFPKLQEIAGQGDAREESCYPALEWLLKECAENRGQSNIRITTLPKRPKPGTRIFGSGTAKSGFPINNRKR